MVSEINHGKWQARQIPKLSAYFINFVQVICTKTKLSETFVNSLAASDNIPYYAEERTTREWPDGASSIPRGSHQDVIFV
jgi:hypothetical protein